MLWRRRFVYDGDRLNATDTPASVSWHQRVAVLHLRREPGLTLHTHACHATLLCCSASWRTTT